MPCLLLQQGKTGKTGKRETVNGKMSKIKSKLNCFVAVVRRCCSCYFFFLFFTRMLFELSRASFVGNLIINQQAKPKWTVPKKKELTPHSPHTHTHTNTQLARAQSEAFYFVPIKWVIAADDPLKTQAICGYWRSEREGDAQRERERELKRVNEAEPAALIPNWKLAGSLHWLWSVVLFLLLRSDKLWKCVADNTMWWRGTY